MNLLRSFQAYIEENHLFNPKDRLLLAVSGGIDSVVLCELCWQGGYEFVIAHADFGLRGEESERDKEFVEGLAKKYAAPFLVKSFDTKGYAALHKVSVQVAARELRYGWFREIIAGKGDSPLIEGRTPKYIVTAHHRDDNIETSLMNFFKGTGIAGLRGMLPEQDGIVRPLLFAGKEQLLGFANDHHLNWVEDSSNATDKYARNYIRHQLVPLLQAIYPGVENNLAANLPRFREIETLYHQAIDQHKKKLLEYKGQEVHIPVLKLKKTEPLATILYEIVKEYGFSPQQITEITSLLDSETGKYVQSATHRIIRNRNWLIIAPLAAGESSHLLIEGAGNWQFAMGNLQLSIHAVADCQLPTANRQLHIAHLDAGMINFPLLLRPWKQGDYFYPLGMKKKKKLSRFLIDQKLSKTEKEKVWVLEMDKKILWVLGMRIDDRFRITGSTTTVLKMELKPS